MNLDHSSVQGFLRDATGRNLELISFRTLGPDPGKRLRFNQAVMLECLDGEQKVCYVLRRPEPALPAEFRVQAIPSYVWRNLQAGNRANADAWVALGYVTTDGCVRSLLGFSDIAGLERYVEGRTYADLLREKAANSVMDSEDHRHVEALVQYFSSRPVVPDEHGALQTADTLRMLEKTCRIVAGLRQAQVLNRVQAKRLEEKSLSWRHRLMAKHRPVVYSHNDLHPWNIIACPDGAMRIIDPDLAGASDPARDLGSLLPNYIQMALRACGNASGMCVQAMREILQQVMERTADEGLLEALRPYFSMVCFIICNPQWFPDQNAQVAFEMKQLGIECLMARTSPLEIFLRTGKLC